MIMLISMGGGGSYSSSPTFVTETDISFWILGIASMVIPEKIHNMIVTFVTDISFWILGIASMVIPEKIHNMIVTFVTDISFWILGIASIVIPSKMPKCDSNICNWHLFLNSWHSIYGYFWKKCINVTVTFVTDISFWILGIASMVIPSKMPKCDSYICNWHLFLNSWHSIFGYSFKNA